MSTFEPLLTNVGKLESSFADMQIEGKVDKKVDRIFEEIISFVAKREKFWFNGEPNKRTFAIYHCWRNLRLIFSKMRTRFANAQQIHDNPLVVDQAIEIFPQIQPAMLRLVSIERNPSEKEQIDTVMREIQKMRASAHDVNMIPSFSEEIKEIDQSKLATVFEGLLNRMSTLGEA